MGQQLYAPPNVKGWEAGKAWLNTATVLARHNFAHALVNGMGDLNEYAKRFNLQTFFPAVNPLAFVLRLGLKEPGKIVDFYADLLLPGDVRPEVKARLVAHIGDSDPDTEGFAQRCRDAPVCLADLAGIPTELESMGRMLSHGTHTPRQPGAGPCRAVAIS